jgi:soluble lytic murein transglycosylase-like protein
MEVVMISVAQMFCLALLNMGMPRAEYACSHMNQVIETAEEHQIRPELFIAMIHVESRWNHEAVSKGYACGLTQVLPKYTRNPKLSCKDLKDPKVSIRVGAEKLHYWIYKYGRGKEKTGLCGYNKGYRCKGKSKNKRGMGYAHSVLRYASRVLKAYNAVERDEADFQDDCGEEYDPLFETRDGLPTIIK